MHGVFTTVSVLFACGIIDAFGLHNSRMQPILPTSGHPQALSVSVDIASKFNNKAASLHPGSGGDFDGNGTTFPARWLPSSPHFQYRGLNFTLANFMAEGNDNYVVDNQTLPIPSGHYALLTLLASGDKDLISRDVIISYDDGSSENKTFLVPGFRVPINSYRAQKGVISTPFTYFSNSFDNNATSISYASISLDPYKNLSSLAFGGTSNGGADGRLHVFAISMFTSFALSSDIAPNTQGIGPNPVFQYVRSTTKLNDTHLEASGEKVQLVEVALHNLPRVSSLTNSTSFDNAWIGTPHTLSIVSLGIRTVFPATVKRLRPGLSARYLVGVVNMPHIPRGTNVTAIATLSDDKGKQLACSSEWQLQAGIPVYKNNDLGSLDAHETPAWYDDSKLGIFVHWGVYSVPAYSPVGIEYAEWYWWQLHVPNNDSSPTWRYHKETYGEAVVYDDFIANFTASKFKAENLVDLFHASGAKYFVQVSKHHDGIAIFDTKNTSNRNTVLLGPKRNLLAEIFQVAKEKYPEMHRGTYFSLPEWFHPDYKPYGMGITQFSILGLQSDGTPIIQKVGWPGGEAHNAYNSSQVEPYTGYVKSPTNYLVDVQAPQMEMLFYDYGIEILWCDIGGANMTASITGTWFNQAYEQNKSVLLNDRCGITSYDFSTPEYATFANVREDKWESNAGLDPFSYGYNAQTPPDRYANASVTIRTLVDIVSKNGNFLVDIGPKPDGTVVQEEIDTLNAMGNWLKYTGPAIYGTKFWTYASQERDDIRFTTTDDAFYIISLVYPNNPIGIWITSPVPIMQGDTITMLGGTGTPISWSFQEDGSIIIKPSIAEINQANYAWAFEIKY